MKRQLSRPALARLRALQDKTERYQQDAFLIEGLKLVQEALGSALPLHVLYISPDLPEPVQTNLQAAARALQIEILPITTGEIAQVTGMKNPEGTLAVGRLSHCLDAVDAFPLPALYLWEMNDPGNLGSVVRTAEWFGIKNIWLSPRSVDPFNVKVVRGTMGALFRVKIKTEVRVEQVLNLTKTRKVDLYAADMDGGPLHPSGSNNWIVALGSESHGLPAELKAASSQVIGIPRYGSGESLNVGVAAGIILYQLRQLGD